MRPIILLGGSSCAGKSTAAKRLGEKLGYQVYHTDDIFLNAPVTPEDQPHMAELRAMKNPLLVWTRPAADCLEFWLAYYQEAFQIFLRELAHFMEEGQAPLLAEGVCLLPKFLEQAGLLDRSRFLVCGTSALGAAMAGKWEFIKEMEALESREEIYAHILTTFSAAAKLVARGANRAGRPCFPVNGPEDYAGNLPRLQKALREMVA